LEFVGVTEPALAYWGKESFVTKNEFLQWYNLTTNSFPENGRDQYADRLMSAFPPEQYDWISGANEINKLSVIYGSTAVKGIPIFRDVTTTKVDGDTLWVVYALGEGECSALTDTEFDGLSVSSGTYSGNVTVTFYPGSDSQTVGDYSSGLETASGDWTTEHRCKGIACAVVKYIYDPELWSGEPDPLFIIDGMKCAGFDLGDPSIFSASPARVLNDYLLNTTYGKGLQRSELDQFANGHSYAGTAVTENDGGSGTISRFAFNGVLDTRQSIKKNVESILFTMIGSLPWIGGKYKLVIKRNDDTADYTFDKDNITGAFKVEEAGIKNYLNQIFYKFTDPLIDYGESMVVYPDPLIAGQADINRALLADDGGRRLKKTITNKYENSRFRSVNRCNTIIKQSRDTLVISLKCNNPDSLQNETGDIVYVTRETQGWVNLPCRISEMIVHGDGDCSFTLSYYDSTNYDWDVPADYTPPSATTLTDPLSVPAPTGITLTDHQETTDDLTSVDAIKVTWTATNEKYNVDKYEVEFSVGSRPYTRFAEIKANDTLEAYLKNVEYGESYIIRVRAVNYLGVPSSWNTTSRTYLNLTARGFDIALYGTDSWKNEGGFYWNPLLDSNDSLYASYTSGSTLTFTNDGAMTLTQNSLYPCYAGKKAVGSIGGRFDYFDTEIYVKFILSISDITAMADAGPEHGTQMIIGNMTDGFGFTFNNVSSTTFAIYGVHAQGGTITQWIIAGATAVDTEFEFEMHFIPDVSLTLVGAGTTVTKLKAAMSGGVILKDTDSTTNLCMAMVLEEATTSSPSPPPSVTLSEYVVMKLPS